MKSWTLETKLMISIGQSSNSFNPVSKDPSFLYHINHSHSSSRWNSWADFPRLDHLYTSLTFSPDDGRYPWFWTTNSVYFVQIKNQRKKSWWFAFSLLLRKVELSHSHGERVIVVLLGSIFHRQKMQSKFCFFVQRPLVGLQDCYWVSMKVRLDDLKS